MADYSKTQVVDAALHILRCNDWPPLKMAEQAGCSSDYRDYQIWGLLMTALTTELLTYIKQHSIDTYEELRIVAHQAQEIIDTGVLTFAPERKDDD